MSDLLCLRPQQPHQPTRRAHWALGPRSTQNHTWLPCQVTTSSLLPQGMMFAKTIVQKFTPRPFSLHIPSTTLIYQQFNSSHRDASHYRRAAQSRSRPLMPMKPKKKKKRFLHTQVLDDCLNYFSWTPRTFVFSSSKVSLNFLWMKSSQPISNPVLHFIKRNSEITTRKQKL